MGPKEDCCICPIPFSYVLNPIFCYVSPPIVNFHEPHIVETCKKCHWIWHALNPKYVPLKQFHCIFPSQYQQNVKFLLEIVIFQEPLIAQRLWNLQALDLACLELLNMYHSSHFDAFFPVKMNKMWNFGCFLISFWQKTEKNINLHREKSVHKGLHICTYRLIGMPIAMHYVRTLCDKYFF